MTKFECSYCGGYEDNLPFGLTQPSTYTALRLEYTADIMVGPEQKRDVCPRCVIQGLDKLFGPRKEVDK